MAPIYVQLSVDKRSYSSGSHIHGSISLIVAPPAIGCTDFSGIHLSLEGNESVKFNRKLWCEEYHIEQEKAIFLRLDSEVVRFSSPMSAGQWDYPFCLELPEDSLPCSMSCKRLEGTGGFLERSECEINYNLTAYLSTCRSDPGWKVMNCTQPIHITASGEILKDYSACDTTIIATTTFKINSWLRNKGYMELGLDTNAKVLLPDSSLVVGITCTNFSAVPIKEVVVQWIETVEWGQSNSLPEKTNRRILAETTVAASELSSVWQPNSRGKQLKGGRSAKVNPIDLSGIPKIDRITTRLPLQEKNARDSFKGQLIQVCHSVQVVVVTEGKYSTNPKISAPMQVKCKSTNK